MISHVVLLQLRADLSEAERRALAESFRRAALGVASVRHVRLGTRISHADEYGAGSAAAEYLIVLDFDDPSGLREYLQHPTHAELSARFHQSLRSASVYDFEMGGLERLDAFLGG